jgi:cobalamin synthase
VLAIMKDSRIGSYAAIGLGLLLLTKWNVLVEIDATFGPPLLAMALVAGHAVSRLALDRADPLSSTTCATTTAANPSRWRSA